MSARGRKPDDATARVKARRLALLIFGVLLVVLFGGVAVASGIGSTSVPSGAVAVVTEMPDGDVTVTQEDFETALTQMAAQAQLEEVPPEDDPQYGQIAAAAFNDLLDVIWIEGEAADRGVEVSQRQIDDQLQQVAQQNFECEADEEPFECRQMRRFLRDSGYTREDVIKRVEIGLLSNELQTMITEEAQTPTESQLKAFYETFNAQFQLPASTDIRVIQTEREGQADRAKAALEEDSSPENWETVAARFSTDEVSKDAGGVREGVTDGMFEEPVQNAIDEATPGELVGPIEADSGYYVVQVDQRNEERVQDFDEVSEQLEQQVAQQLSSSSQIAFVDNYRNIWTARTFCAEDFLNDRCANADGENFFLTDADREAAAEATEGQAPALSNRVAWPKPPNTLTLPIDPVTANGTQIVCYLAEQPDGQNFPLTGTAPPQRPHPPGPTEAINEPPEGTDPASVPPACGAVDPAAALGGVPPMG